MHKGLKLLLFVIISTLFSGCDDVKEFFSKGNTVKQENNTTSNSTENNSTRNGTQEHGIDIRPEDNITIPKESPKMIRVACVGDSITMGVGIASAADTYPAQLSKVLGNGWEVKNFGVKSATLLRTGSSPYVAKNAYENSKKYNPDIVVIVLGTNDAKHGNWAKKQHFIADYTALIKSYKNLPSQPLVYIGYPPPVKKAKVGISTARIQNEVIPKIKQVASLNSVEVVDIYQAFSNKKGLIGDHVHPNVAGAGVIANTVYKVIY